MQPNPSLRDHRNFDAASATIENKKEVEFRRGMRSLVNLYATLILLGTGWAVWPDLFWGIVGRRANVVLNTTNEGKIEGDRITWSPYLFRDHSGKAHYLTSEDLKRDPSVFNFLNSPQNQRWWRTSIIEYVSFAPRIWTANRYVMTTHKRVYFVLLVINGSAFTWLFLRPLMGYLSSRRATQESK